MEIIYQIDDIGIYFDSNNTQWKTNTKSKLHEQLKGFEKLNQQKILRKIIMRDYEGVVNLLKDKGTIVPESSIYGDRIFIELELKVAFRISSDKIEFWCHSSSWLSMPFILQMLLVQQNETFVHAAAISYRGNGILIPAFGGIGKTSFVSQALKKEGVKLLGDDLCIINTRGTMKAYSRPFCLYKYHKELFPEYYKNSKCFFMKNIRWNRALMKIINKFAGKKICTTTYVTVSPSILFSNEKIEQDEVPITHVYLTQRARNITDAKIREVNKEEVANFCVAVISHEWYALSKLLFNYLAQSRQSVGQYFKGLHSTILTAIYNAEKVYEITVPEKLSATDVSKVLNSIILEEKRNEIQE